MRTIKAASLVLDHNLYPRNNVDRHNVLSIKDALAAGETLPPVICDKRSKRVTDGFHRVIATLEMDPEGTIDVIEKAYKNEQEMFLDSMRLNASHGAKLDSCDRTRCLLIAERLSIPVDSVAGALHVPVDRLGKLRNERTATTSRGLEIPLKRTFRHMADKRLNKRQIEANERSSGMNQAFYVNQLIDMLESDLLDKSDEGLLERLRHLHGLLDELLAAK
jgi:hypothetical protein